MSLSSNLISFAMQARTQAYAPYSDFQVGAAVYTGAFFRGCNIENASYGLTICAERVAIFAAIAAGQRDLQHMVVVANTPVPISPCGACRQVMFEFAPNMVVWLMTVNGEKVETTPTLLLPGPFGLSHIAKYSQD